MMRHRQWVFAIPALLFCFAASAADYVPRPGEFPPPDAGHYFAGELVAVDHVNRRGALRLVGDNNNDRYHRAESHRFALLPYGTVRYRGAPAELRDVPLGTVLHGDFVLPPEGDHTIPPPADQQRKYVPKYTSAISLEDDFSFYQRRGQAWKLVAVNLDYDSSSAHFPPLNANGDWRATPIPGGSLTALLVGEGDDDGLRGEQVFTVDRSTRLWRGRKQIDWEDLAPPEQWNRGEGHRLALNEESVQLGLTWAPDWKNGQFHVADIWFDAASRALATETQRRIHIRHMRHRWLPGWIDHVEHDTGGGGVVTVTLFGGVDETLLDAVRRPARSQGGVAIAAGEWTLRTWWQEHDNKGGRVIEFQEISDPPVGSSGMQLRVRMGELLVGFAPGRIVRLRPHSFPNVKLPPEERVQGMSERIPPPYNP